MPTELMQQFMQCAAETLGAETERWCWRAIGKGVGWRVWRSEPRWEDFHIIHQFALLPPGASPPGSGTIYGPFSKGEGERGEQEAPLAR